MKNETAINKKIIKIGTVCSGIGSPEVSIRKHNHEIVFGCEIDKYARASYAAIHGEVQMFTDMTSEDFHSKSDYCDLVVGGIPCQSFSLAGNRLGEMDKRGLLFYDFYRYVKEKQPKVFIIENVKGLLSDNGGKTFQNWLLLLSRSINHHEQMFLHPDSLEYNVHHFVLNSKNFGVPQNRERVFVVGIRKDLSNDFRPPIGWKLDKRLKDVLETDVDEKYYLSDKMLQGFANHQEQSKRKGRGFKFDPMVDTENKTASTVTARCFKMGVDDNYITETTNLQGKEYINTIRTGGRCSLTDKHNWDMVVEPICVAMRGRNPENPNDRTPGAPTEQRLELNSQGTTNTITSVQKDNLIVEPNLMNDDWVQGGLQEHQKPRTDGICPTLTSAMGMGGGQTPIVNYKSRIRRLTPLECWRLQGFSDDDFYKAKQVNSDTQLYKQAGNSITTNVMEAIIDNLIDIFLK